MTADADGTRVYHGFVPAGVERLIIDHGTKTEEMMVTSDGVPLDPLTAERYGVHVS
ncbi:MAG TPA: hypothetical protein VGU66_13095 [Candidatus Elarobacter sp.]|nr:hypothetical protein [Candidatus Elarobacter sp.]